MSPIKATLRKLIESGALNEDALPMDQAKHIAGRIRDIASKYGYRPSGVYLNAGQRTIIIAYGENSDALDDTKLAGEIDHLNQDVKSNNVTITIASRHFAPNSVEQSI